MIVLVLGALVGCDKQRDDAVAGPVPPVPVMPRDIPEGSRVTFTETYEGGVINESARGTGSGLTATGDKAATTIDSTAPSVGLRGGGSASGGGTKGTLSALTVDGAASNPFVWAAVLAFVVAAAAGFFRMYSAAVCAALLGAVLLACAVTPYAVLGVAAILGVVLWLNRRKVLTTDALRSVAAGVEDIDDEELRRGVKGNIKKHATPAEEAVIRAIKQIDGLPSERPNSLTP